MTRIVVTGSTRGIGYGLAREFLARGCAVVVNGRAHASVERAVHYLTKSLLAETKGTPVLIGTLAPGMVVTDIFLSNIDDSLDSPAQVRRLLNLLGERVETVAPFLVERMLANDRTGSHIEWLTKRRIVAYVLLAPFRRRQIVAPGELEP